MLAPLVLLCHKRETTRAFDLIEHDDFDPEVNRALYDVLARFTFDSRLPRATTVAFLERIERDGLIEDGDMTWWGWAQAVIHLGLTALEPALRRVWAKPINETHTQADHDAALEELRLNASRPGDPSTFDEEDLRPIDDPVEAVAWIEKRAAAMAKWSAENIPDTGSEVDDDPAKDVRLTVDERDWLAGFLTSRQAPETTMTFETFDGFLTGLIVGPEPILPSEYLPVIWGGDGEGPIGDSREQAEFALGLVMKHWNAIAARRSARSEHRPDIAHFAVAAPATEWADGFAIAMELCPEAWDPIFEDRRTDQLVLPILALTGDVPEDVNEAFTPDMRATVLEALPVTLEKISQYWRDHKHRQPRPAPVRAAKVGRNDPCPCGSGAKYKKCCGGPASSSVH